MSFYSWLLMMIEVIRVLVMFMLDRYFRCIGDMLCSEILFRFSG